MGIVEQSVAQLTDEQRRRLLGYLTDELTADWEDIDRVFWHTACEHIARALAPGMRWKNVHTEAEEQIVGMGSGDDAHGFVRVPPTFTVQTPSNVPPGYQHTANSGMALRAFLEHWEPA